ncbi:response regulator receiver [Oleiphilus messinensis]|uniref:Response regulator receiver n=1 Tax=Oleiphilus messinensis TaxID=141451 RepID=A0A1Y0IDG6_9GAMM|nr:tetratricopeptide repeat-containing response regulator [Oleiphilus messinensis]ARU58310.1 response regulator receiver [Oleiphilus messinensis]
MLTSKPKINFLKVYSKLKFLVVDDFENFRLSIRQMLRSFGVEHIDTASNGEEAVQRCTYERYDIVLCDYNMGDRKNGQHILEELRFKKLIRRTGLFILITAETSKDIVMGAREYAPDGYIAKPITKAVLQKRLDALIEQREILLPINQEIDKENYPAAITACDQILRQKTKYTTWCLRTMGELYLLTGDYAHARKVYEDILSSREIPWARLGVGKVQIAEQQYKEAIDTFKGILEQNKDMVEAYDYLAEIYRLQGKSKEAQKHLEKATQLSPLGILRQTQLGELCTQNQDLGKAAGAYRNAVKLGLFSCHDSSENYLQLGRTLSDLSEGNATDQGKQYAKEAITTLGKAAKRFEEEEDIKLKSLLIETRVHQGQNDQAASRKTFEAAQKLAEGSELPADTCLEMAKTFYKMGDTDKAEKMLFELAQRCNDDKSILNKIEDLLDEPGNLENKMKARELNRKGISYFEEGKLNEAVNIFQQALSETPKHPALNLNLVQVLLKAMEKQGKNPQQIAQCKGCLDRVKHIPTQHRQYKRLQFLIKKVSAL